MYSDPSGEFAIVDDAAIIVGTVVIIGVAVLSTPQGKKTVNTVGKTIHDGIIGIGNVIGNGYNKIKDFGKSLFGKDKSKSKVKNNSKSKSKPKSLKMLDDKYLKRNGIDPHEFKREWGFKKEGAHYDIYQDNDGYIWIYPKKAQHGGINTYMKIK